MSFFTEELAKTVPEEGFISLVDGYGKYAMDVATNRAIPGIDGFKPANRRILYTMNKYKVTDLQKSANVCGKVLEFHPHSDASVYETMLPMVDSSEYSQFPYLHGKGNFSKVFFSDKDSQAAASRYTEVCLSDKARVLFGEMDGVEFRPTEDAHTTEPALLPVSFPNILMQPSQGIAVGIACNIPSYNFNEVIAITLEYLRTGKITQAIAPDFNCGGELVLNNEMLKQIMLTGRGSIKLRGKWRIENERDIVITQIPFYARISDILSVARTLPGVAVANDETDLRGMRIRITCTQKAYVQAVLLQLLRDSKLQCSVGVNIRVVIDDDPRSLGIVQVIEEWVKFRERVLQKQYTLDLEKVRYSMRAPKALVELISNQALKERFLDALKSSAQEAERILREAMPDVDSDVIDYILDLPIRKFADCEARKRQYRQLQEQEAALQKALSNLKATIINQLVDLNQSYKIPRKTSIVTNDYSFESLEEAEAAEVAVMNYSVKVQINGLYLRKFRFYSGTEKCLSTTNDKTLLLLDSKGRIHRVPLSQISDTPAGGVGVYLPNLLKCDRDFSIIDTLVQGEEPARYLYKDGWAAVLDPSEWEGRKAVLKTVADGLAPDHIDKMMMRLDGVDSPYLLFVTKNKNIGIADMNFKVKSRHARTKLTGCPEGDEIVAVCPLSMLELTQLFPSTWSTRVGKCKAVSDDEGADFPLLAKIFANKL